MEFQLLIALLFCYLAPFVANIEWRQLFVSNSFGELLYDFDQDLLTCLAS